MSTPAAYSIGWNDRMKGYPRSCIYDARVFPQFAEMYHKGYDDASTAIAARAENIVQFPRKT